MLRANVQVSSAAAKEYYTEALSRQDYYSEDQEVAGLWGGKGAERMGLTGEVDREGFIALCENRVPHSSDNLTPRTKKNRRVGYDFNFHVPKSVSVMSQVMGDDRIIPEFRQAVAETMIEIEEAMRTRVRKGGKGDRHTGNIVWGEFVHTTSRPVDGVPDCHVHAHNFIFNATWDDSEQRWKAGEFGNIKRDMEYYEAAFHSRLAERMVKLGYEVERKGKFWELARVSQGVAEKYSRRAEQVKAEAEKRGITNPKLKDYLAGYTRQRKSAADPQINLKQEWLKRLTDEERSGLSKILLEARLKAGSGNGGSAAAAKSVGYALAHHFQNQSVTSERKLLATALRQSLGQAGISEIRSALTGAAVKRVMLDDMPQITTEEAIKEEAELILLARGGIGKEDSIKSARHKFKRHFLSKDQKAAVQHVLSSKDQLTVIRGGAGTGKTTLMQETAEAIREAGKQVFTFAPTADARDVLRKEGFAAYTVARLLSDPEQQAKLDGGIMWVDEAGQLSVPDMLALLRLAAGRGARLVLSGDERQHSSVARGDALRILKKFAGIKTAEVVEIQRQRGQYKEAIKAISKGRIADGLEMLESMGSIREMDPDSAYAEIAGRYTGALKRGKSALIVSPTHREGAKVTDVVRRQLREDGLLGKREWNLIRQINLNLTHAEKTDSQNYTPGLVLQFVQNAKGFSKGDRVVVTAVEPGRIGCARAAGHPVSWWLDLATVKTKHFQVYRSEEFSVAGGEKIRITQGGRGKHGRLETGRVLTLKSVMADGTLEMTNGTRISRDYGHWSYGYVSTSHAAQGKTVDEIYIAQGRESFAAAGREQFYVSVSRGKETVIIYTDDKEAMFEAVGLARTRLSATELLNPSHHMDQKENDQPGFWQRVFSRRAKAEPAEIPSKDPSGPGKTNGSPGQMDAREKELGSAADSAFKPKAPEPKAKTKGEQILGGVVQNKTVPENQPLKSEHPLSGKGQDAPAGKLPETGKSHEGQVLGGVHQSPAVGSQPQKAVAEEKPHSQLPGKAVGDPKPQEGRVLGGVVQDRAPQESRAPSTSENKLPGKEGHDPVKGHTATPDKVPADPKPGDPPKSNTTQKPLVSPQAKRSEAPKVESTGKPLVPPQAKPSEPPPWLKEAISVAQDLAGNGMHDKGRGFEPPNLQHVPKNPIKPYQAKERILGVDQQRRAAELAIKQQGDVMRRSTILAKFDAPNPAGGISAAEAPANSVKKGTAPKKAVSPAPEPKPSGTKPVVGKWTAQIQKERQTPKPPTPRPQGPRKR